MSEPERSHSQDNNTPAKQPPSPESVSAIVKNFRDVFELMSLQLEFAQVVGEDEEMKKLDDSDIRGFLQDVMKFAAYVRTWEIKKIGVSESITSTKGVREYLQKIGVHLNTALCDDARLEETNRASIDMIQYDRGKEVYFARLANCSNILLDMIKTCFVDKY